MSQLSDFRVLFGRELAVRNVRSRICHNAYISPDLTSQVSWIVIAPLAKLSVIPDAFTACGVPRAPNANTFPPARDGESEKNICSKLVVPVDHAAVDAGKLNGPPHVSTEGVAAEAIGKLAWLLITAMRA